MKIVFVITALGLFIFSGTVMGSETSVIELDEDLCKNLAWAYGSDPTSLTVKELTILEFCLALTFSQQPVTDLSAETSPAGFRIQIQGPSSGNGDTIPPKKPTGLRVVK